MYVLGFAGGFDPVYGTLDRKNDHRFNMHEDELHDSSAVLLKDGEIVAAIEEERLTRIKHTNTRAVQSIRFCLEHENIGIEDVDYISYPCTESKADRLLAMTSLRNPDTKPFWNARSFFSHLLSEEFNAKVDEGKFRFVEHHAAHALSAYCVSGFKDSLVVTLDGQGEGLSGTVFDAVDGNMKRISNIVRNNSLGLLYEAVISFLGYKQHDEYKVMGLAPYGDPSRYRHLVKSLYQLRNDNIAERLLNRRKIDRSYKVSLSNLGALREVGEPRRKGEPFEQRHKDLAASLQEAHETIVMHHLDYYRKRTGQTKLCLAGGVAHNCSANGKIHYSGMFDDIFIQPAAHDAGLALGAAFDVHRKEKPGTPIAPMTHVYYGTNVPEESELENLLTGWSEFVEFEKVEDVAKEAAALLADGSVIGWVQGRSEFGPRALGNRCILADPRPEHNKTRINAMVKKREAYRPFAPSVQEEHASQFFNVESNSSFPFMILITTVKEDKRELLGATTHIDGTARIHTVSKTQNPLYWELIDNFRQLTDVAVVLNTSFNNNVEPIVDSAHDALVAYLTTELDTLFIGDFRITRKSVSKEHISRLCPELPDHIQLQCADVYQSPDSRLRRHSLYTANKPNSDYDISAEVHGLLSELEPNKTIDQALNGAPREEKLTDEIWDLWEKRLIVLKPPSAHA